MKSSCVLHTETKRNMLALFISSCWFYFAKLALFLIKFLGRHVFRIKIEEFSVPLEPVSESNEIEERKFNGFGEEEHEEPSSFSFKFEYQIPKVNTISNEDESFQAKSMSIRNYRFLSQKDFSGFAEEPEAVTFQVHESFVANSEEKLESEFLSAIEFEDVMFSKDQKLEVRSPIVSDTSLDSDSSGNCEKHSIQSEHIMFLKDQKMEARCPIVSEFASLSQNEVIYNVAGDFDEPVTPSHEEMFLEDQNLEGRSPCSFDTNFDSDSDSISLSDGYSVKNFVVDSDSDGFLSERDFGDKESFIDSSTFEVELVEDMENIEGGQSSNCENVFNDCFLSERGFVGPEKISEEKNYSPHTDKLSQLDEAWSENDSLEAELERKELNAREIDKLPSSSKVQIEFMDSSDDEPAHAELDSSNARTIEMDEVLGRDTEGCAKNTTEEKSEETRSKDLDNEELDELESLWEHQDLIEQLKMELKRVRAVGLPTIFEESESPKTMEDLKPWKIDEKFLREDPIDELHKFYKSYCERMRKFDILNYQKMYAIGFLQLKDPLESMVTQKPLIPTILSHFSQNLKPIFRRKSSTDPSGKFMKELQVDLETVYVGQTCLSWEFLRWQYEKARELPDSVPYRSHQYNQVVGEFQRFQVLLQRFTENESFQGPRLPNYVKNRCVLRNLLQVPVIKEDCLKEKMEGKNKGNYTITSEMLEDIMEESIRIFWEFVKADKDETSIILKGLIGNQVELQDPSDFELMSEIQASLQKKEKKLKDILKTGNCLVKKFKKPREDRSNQDIFFSQVDMKLVSRVLKMSHITTDQLVWCHKKLSKIIVSDRKIHREPSFLLFPC